MEQKATFCAEGARTVKDPLLGTATEAALWLLLEVRTAWRATVDEDNDLPPAVQEHLQEELTAAADSRLLFIKQAHAQNETLRFFVVNSAARPPRMLELHLHDYDELLELDLMGLADGSAAGAERYRREEPLFLVCTNGKRDKCCAKFGMAAYGALQQEFGEAVWQSSHMGGHRYAPNLLLLPHAFEYGGQEGEGLVATAAAYREGRLVDLEHLRGRTTVGLAAQAGEVLLRGELGLAGADDLWLDTAVEGEEGVWMLGFVTAGDERVEMALRQSWTEPQLVSCSPDGYKRLPRFERVG